jgi:hypothetical protein
VPERPTSRVVACRREQHVEDAVFGEIFGLVTDLARGVLARFLDRGFDEVAHDRIHVAPDVADLGELRRFDFDERRIGKPRKPPRDLGLAYACRADHEDVLGRDFLTQRLFDLLPAPAVAQCDCNRTVTAPRW